MVTGSLRDYDNIADRETIMLGINLFKSFAVAKNLNNLTAVHVLQGLENIYSLDDARVVHLCFDTSRARFTKE